MVFSLILATIGRTKDLQDFLLSLDAQTYRNFELIVVDQNEDDRVESILGQFRHRFPILHLRSPRGLSRARNEGLRHVSGDIVAFPDDDCLYPPDLLAKVARWFAEHPNWHGLTGRSVTREGVPSNGTWDRAGGKINRFNVWHRATSFSIFLQRKVADAVGPFDTSLGVGSGTPWGSAEEIDYLIRALQAGFRLYYDPDVIVFHPNKIPTPPRTYRYASGMGRVLRKHNYPFWFLAYYSLRSLGGAFWGLLSGRWDRASVYWAALRGRIYGWCSGHS